MTSRITVSQFTAAHGKLLLVMSLDPKEIGRRIKTAREARGWIQMDLAIEANVSMSTVTRWESGKLPAVRELIRLAGILEISPSYLVEGESVIQSQRDEDVWAELAEIRRILEELQGKADSG